MSSDHKPIQDWLNGKSARDPASFKGQTALYAAIQSAVEQLQPAERGDAIYLISDGGENASHVNKSKVEDALTSSGIRLFALLVTSGGPVTQEEQQGPVDMLQVSKDSGGFSKTVDLGETVFPSVASVLYDDHMKEKIRRYSQQFALEITTLYSVTLQLSENLAGPQHIEISAVDGQGHKRKGLSVAYPHKVSPCNVGSVRR